MADTDLTPQYIGIEYPELAPQWPALLVQFRPDGKITWTGINPDQIVPTTDVNFPWEAIRVGHFTGSFDVTVLALHSAERNRLWDCLIQLILMGSLTPNQRQFIDLVNNSDVISMTMTEDSVEQQGDSIGAGVPWDPDLLSYEATIRFRVVGQFWTNWSQQKLVAVSDVQVLPYTDLQSPPDDADGLGPWLS